MEYLTTNCSDVDFNSHLPMQRKQDILCGLRNNVSQLYKALYIFLQQYIGTITKVGMWIYGDNFLCMWPRNILKVGILHAPLSWKSWFSQHCNYLTLYAQSQILSKKRAYRSISLNLSSLNLLRCFANKLISAVLCQDFRDFLQRLLMLLNLYFNTSLFVHIYVLDFFMGTISSATTTSPH